MSVCDKPQNVFEFPSAVIDSKFSWDFTFHSDNVGIKSYPWAKTYAAWKIWSKWYNILDMVVYGILVLHMSFKVSAKQHADKGSVDVVADFNAE